MTVSVLNLAHVEWLGVRSSLSGGERRSFAKWAARNKPEIVKKYRGQSTLYHLQCREIQHGRNPKKPGIGPALFERYAVSLTRRYLALPEEGKPTFSTFLEEVLRKCKTEVDLRIFLDAC